MPKASLFNDRDRARLSRLIPTLVGGLMGAIAVPIPYVYVSELVIRCFRLRIGDDIRSQPILGLAIGGAIVGGLILSKSRGLALPRWVASSSLGALAGMFAMFILASLHASTYEVKFDGPVRMAWLVYGTIPFLAIGALFGVFIDRRKQNARLPIETE